MINVDRSIVDEPEIEGNYRTDKILEALNSVFLSKCYLCEKKLPSSSLFEIDHFMPISQNEELKYFWSNLYLCCRECNSTRLKNLPEGGFLDPCENQDDVESLIIYDLPCYKFNEPVFSPRNREARIEVLNSIDQLKRMHYGNRRTSIKCASLRETISKRATKLLALIIEENYAIKNNDHILSAARSQQIEQLISRNSPFTMLMRSVNNKYRLE